MVTDLYIYKNILESEHRGLRCQGERGRFICAAVQQVSADLLRREL